MKVLVVSYAPAGDRAATGGFDWFPWSADGFDAAQERLRAHIEQAADDPRVCTPSTFVLIEVPDEVAYRQAVGDLDTEAVTGWLEGILSAAERHAD